jgi:hypothetical protein
METTIKSRKRPVQRATVDKTIRDHSKDPFVVKKNKAAKKLLDKYGLPKGLK